MALSPVAVSSLDCHRLAMSAVSIAAQNAHVKASITALEVIPNKLFSGSFARKSHAAKRAKTTSSRMQPINPGHLIEADMEKTPPVGMRCGNTKAIGSMLRKFYQ
jgi:hypothetical protein